MFFVAGLRVVGCNAELAIKLGSRGLATLCYPPSHPSLLPLVKAANNLHLSLGGRDAQTFVHSGTEHERSHESVVPFYVSKRCSQPVGLIRRQTMDALQADLSAAVGESSWEISRHTDGTPSAVSFTDTVNNNGKYGRTMHMERLVRGWKDKNYFSDVLRGWSDEAFPVYNHPKSDQDDPLAFNVERAALPLFGLPNFGALLVAYTHCSTSGDLKVWVPRRSWTKKTWPGKLDVTVGGGINSSDSALATILRESEEEASLDSAFVQKHIRPVGILPFPHRSPSGLILPGTYFLFDLPLPSDNSVIPSPNDDEVEGFELMDGQTILGNLLDGNFKGSSAVAMVDFLIRHGLVTEDNEPQFVEVCAALKRHLPLSAPWRSM